MSNYIIFPNSKKINEIFSDVSLSVGNYIDISTLQRTYSNGKIYYDSPLKNFIIYDANSENITCQMRVAQFTNNNWIPPEDYVFGGSDSILDMALS